MKHIKDLGVVVYLDVQQEDIAQRLQRMKVTHWSFVSFDELCIVSSLGSFSSLKTVIVENFWAGEPNRRSEGRSRHAGPVEAPTTILRGKLRPATHRRTKRNARKHHDENVRSFGRNEQPKRCDFLLSWTSLSLISSLRSEHTTALCVPNHCCAESCRVHVNERSGRI